MFKPRLEKQPGSLKNEKDCAGCDLRSCFTSDDCVIGHYLLILLSLVKSKGVLKNPQYCLNVVGEVSLVECCTFHIIHIMG